MARVKQWIPWNTGADLQVVLAGAVTRFFIMSIAELAVNLDRKVQEYTVARHIFEVTAASQVATAIVYSMGLIMLPRTVVIGSIDPANTPFSPDWLWWYQKVARGSGPSVDSTIQESQITNVDIRAMRKATSQANELYFYIFNRGTVTLEYSAAGRTLLIGR